MLKIITIFLCVLIFLSGCVKQELPSPLEVERLKNKYTTLKISPYKTQEVENNYKNNFYFNQSKKILNKINAHYYGDNAYYLNIKLILINSNHFSIEALPNNSILITTAFLDLLNTEFFTEDELTGILCHESAHILNSDWDNLIREEHKTIKLIINGRFATFNEIASSLITSKIYKGQHLQHTLMTNNQFYLPDDDSKLIKLTISDLLNTQNFSEHIEYNADIQSIDCLNSLNITNSKKVIISMLNKINYLFKNDELFNRIKRIK